MIRAGEIEQPGGAGRDPAYYRTPEPLHWRIDPETALPITKWEVNGPYNYQSFATVYPPEIGKDVRMHWTVMDMSANGLLDLFPGYGTFRNSALFAAGADLRALRGAASHIGGI